MSITELNEKATAYFDLMAQIDELTAQAESIKDTMKAVMVDRATEELEGTGWRATWHNTVTTRFDSKGFKAAHADLFAEFSSRVNGTRFTLNRVRA